MNTHYLIEVPVVKRPPIETLAAEANAELASNPATCDRFWAVDEMGVHEVSRSETEEIGARAGLDVLWGEHDFAYVHPRYEPEWPEGYWAWE
jgi:hypothetical protein